MENTNVFTKAVTDIKDIPWEAVGIAQPQKLIKTVEDMPQWQKSRAYFNLLGFINGISEDIQGITLTDNFYVSEAMKKLLHIFVKLNQMIDETPPIDEPNRFGNAAYRSWSVKMNNNIFRILQESIPEDKCDLVTELGFYLCESFGNATRIDYGTGHELSFIFFLCALYKCGILNKKDNAACALALFNTYLLFVRRLQSTYRMEPAGSQGVWSLDDYQFIPFVWGSAQLAYNSPFPPTKFLDENISEKYKNNYMFISCIDYIRNVKTGHFAEHSYQLWCISAVTSWTKIYLGLIKMYEKEILAKHPVIQHVYFGKLMSFEPVPPGTLIMPARLGMPKPITKIPSEQFKAPDESHSEADVQSTSATESSPK